MRRMIDVDELDKALELIPVLALKEECKYVHLLVSLGHVLALIERQPVFEVNIEEDKT